MKLFVDRCCSCFFCCCCCCCCYRCCCCCCVIVGKKDRENSHGVRVLRRFSFRKHPLQRDHSHVAVRQIHRQGVAPPVRRRRHQDGLRHVSLLRAAGVSVGESRAQHPAGAVGAHKAGLAVSRGAAGALAHVAKAGAGRAAAIGVGGAAPSLLILKVKLKHF